MPAELGGQPLQRCHGRCDRARSSASGRPASGPAGWLGSGFRLDRAWASTAVGSRPRASLVGRIDHPERAGGSRAIAAAARISARRQEQGRQAAKPGPARRRPHRSASSALSSSASRRGAATGRSARSGSGVPGGRSSGGSCSVRGAFALEAVLGHGPGTLMDGALDPARHSPGAVDQPGELGDALLAPALLGGEQRCASAAPSRMPATACSARRTAPSTADEEGLDVAALDPQPVEPPVEQRAPAGGQHQQQATSRSAASSVMGCRPRARSYPRP